MPYRRKRFGVKRRPFRRLARGSSRRKGTSRRGTLWKKRKGRASSMLIRQPTVVADRLKIKFRYVLPTSITSTSGALNYTQFRGNSLFDPDFTGAGTQPYGYDQWSPFYQYYRVTGSSINVLAIGPQFDAGNNQNCILFGCYPHPTAVNTPASLLQSLERPYRKWKMSVGSSSAKVIKAYMSTAKIFGETKVSVTSEDNYQATTSANPATQWLWTVFAATADGSTTATILVYVTITYYAILTTRAQLATS